MRKTFLITIAILSIFFLSAQSCTFGVAGQCTSPEEIVCDTTDQAHQCQMSEFGYFVTRAPAFDNQCGDGSDGDDNGGDQPVACTHAHDPVCPSGTECINFECLDTVPYPIMVACTDTDTASNFPDGLNVLEPGTTTGTFAWDGTSVTKTDTCLQGEIIEYYCSSTGPTAGYVYSKKTPCATGHACQPGGYCGSQAEPGCLYDNECGFNQICVNYQCIDGPPLPDSCTTAADCSSGMVCTAGVCEEPPTGPSCNEDMDCVNLGLGFMKCHFGECKTSCSTDADCANGFYCDAGECLDPISITLQTAVQTGNWVNFDSGHILDLQTPTHSSGQQGWYYNPSPSNKIVYVYDQDMLQGHGVGDTYIGDSQQDPYIDLEDSNTDDYIYFDGTDSNNDDLFTFNNWLVVRAVVRHAPDESDGSRPIVAHMGSQCEANYFLASEDGVYGFGALLNDGMHVVSGGIVQEDTWQEVVGAYSFGRLFLFVDGNLVATELNPPFQGVASSEDLFIGAGDPNCGVYDFEGDIDVIEISSDGGSRLLV